MPALPNFDEIRALVEAMPPVDSPPREHVRAAILRDHGLEYEDEAGMAAWLAGAERRESPSVAHPRVAVFVAVHGVAADLDRGSRDAAFAEIALLADHTSDLHRLIAARDADLRVYELALHVPTVDSRIDPAMREDETARAMAYGMMAVEPGLDVIAPCARGLGADIAAAAILAILAPGVVPSAIPGRARISAAARRHAALDDPLAILAALGGPDIAAIMGAILAARLAGVAVILDGMAAAAAGEIVRRLRPDGLDHCLSAGPHGDAPQGALAALDLLGQATALLDP
jgi:nicotinate-nucleotide--dimethylbenzimidazole phosphoribosyltransferase